MYKIIHKCDLPVKSTPYIGLSNYPIIIDCNYTISQCGNESYYDNVLVDSPVIGWWNFFYSFTGTVSINIHSIDPCYKQDLIKSITMTTLKLGGCFFWDHDQLYKLSYCDE